MVMVGDVSFPGRTWCKPMLERANGLPQKYYGKIFLLSTILLAVMVFIAVFDGLFLNGIMRDEVVMVGKYFMGFYLFNLVVVFFVHLFLGK